MCRSQFCVYLVANADRMAQICLISCTPLYRGGTGIVITHVCVWVCLCCPSVHMTIHECVDGCQPNLVHMGNLGKGWQKFRMGGVKIEAPRGWGEAWGGGVSSPEKICIFASKSHVCDALWHPFEVIVLLVENEQQCTKWFILQCYRQPNIIFFGDGSRSLAMLICHNNLEQPKQHNPGVQHHAMGAINATSVRGFIVVM